MSEVRWQRRLRRRSGGAVGVVMEPGERALLRSLCAQLRDTVAEDTSPTIDRLYPPAYPQNPDHEAEWVVFTRSGLRDDRLAAIDLVSGTLDADTLTHDEADTWMRVFNDIRLWLGTILGITEDMDAIADDHPQATAFAVYQFLTAIVDDAVDALSP